MSEATEYLLENISKTFEIYYAISKMETEVLAKFDKSIRKAFSSWVNGEWISPEEENLHEDYCGSSWISGKSPEVPLVGRR